MKLDLFMELASPPGAGIEPAEALDSALSIARAADRLAFDAIWLPEHHFLGDYCSSAAPDLILAAIARETQRLRLGLGVIPLPIHDPVRVAERLATLDLLSEGRLLWGVGRGVTTTELEGFGLDPRRSREIFEDRFTALRSLLVKGAFSRGDKRYELRPRPTSSLSRGWLAAVSPESFELAARLGLNVMTGPFKPWPMVRTDLARYRRLTMKTEGSAFGETSFSLAVYCEPDHATARERAEAGILWVYRKIMEVSRPLLARQIEGYEHYRTLGRVAPLLDRVLNLRSLEAMGLAAVGSPAHLVKRLSRLEQSGLDRVSLIVGGGDLTAEETITCLTLIAEQVRPRLQSAMGSFPQAVPA